MAALLVNKWSNYLQVKMFDVRIEASRPHGCGLMTGQSNGQILTGQSFYLSNTGESSRTRSSMTGRNSG